MTVPRASDNGDGLAFGYDSSGNPVSYQSLGGAITKICASRGSAAAIATGTNYMLAFYSSPSSGAFTAAQHASWIGQGGSVVVCDGAPVVGSCDSAAGKITSLFNRNSATGTMDRGNAGEAGDWFQFYAPAGTAPPTDVEIAAMFAGGNGCMPHLCVPAGWTLLNSWPFTGPASTDAGQVFPDTEDCQLATATGTPAYSNSNLKNAPRAADYTGLAVTDTTNLTDLWEFGYYVDSAPNRLMHSARSRTGTGRALAAKLGTITNNINTRMPQFFPEDGSTSATRAIRACASMGSSTYNDGNRAYFTGADTATYTNGTAGYVFHIRQTTQSFGMAIVGGADPSTSLASSYEVLLELGVGKLVIGIYNGGKIAVNCNGTGYVIFDQCIAQSSWFTLSVDISHPGGTATPTITVRIDDLPSQTQSAAGSYAASSSSSHIASLGQTQGDARGRVQIRQFRIYSTAGDAARHLSACKDFKTTYGAEYAKNRVLVCFGSSTPEGSHPEGGVGFFGYMNTGKARVYNFCKGSYADTAAAIYYAGTNGTAFIVGETVTETPSGKTGKFLAEAGGQVALTMASADLTGSGSTLTGVTSGASRTGCTAPNTQIASSVGCISNDTFVQDAQDALNQLRTGERGATLSFLSTNTSTSGVPGQLAVDCAWARVSQKLTPPSGFTLKHFACTAHPRSGSSPDYMEAMRTVLLADTRWTKVFDYSGPTNSDGAFATYQGGSASHVSGIGFKTITVGSVVRNGTSATIACTGHGFSVGKRVRIQESTDAVSIWAREFPITSVPDVNSFVIGQVAGAAFTMSGTWYASVRYTKDSIHITTEYYRNAARQYLEPGLRGFLSPRVVGSPAAIAAAAFFRRR